MRISDWSSDVCSSDLDWRGITSEDWRSGIETGLLSPIEFTNAVVGGMIARGWGRIVHIATGAAKYPHVLRLLSGAPRAALVNYAVAMAKVLTPHGVTINNMLPFIHPTPGIRPIYYPPTPARGTLSALDVSHMVQ